MRRTSFMDSARTAAGVQAGQTRLIQEVDSLWQYLYKLKQAGGGGGGGVGPQGPQGPPGNDGTDGIDGVDGINGTNGTDGIDGVDGADGVGVPIGGTTGQVLAKNSNTNFDTEWVAPSGGATELNDLTDVNTGAGPNDNDLLKYDAGSSLWVPSDVALDELSDVVTAGVANGNVLSYDSGGSEWVVSAEVIVDAVSTDAVYALTTNLFLGGAPGITIDTAGASIGGLPSPVAADDAATKDYVDSQLPGLVFADATFRDAFFTAPVVGDTCSVQDSNSWQYYDGTGWLGWTSWANYTPTLTNVTLGSGTLVGRVKYAGTDAWVSFSLVFGAGTAFTGAVTFSVLDDIADPHGHSGKFTPLGRGQAVNSGVLAYDAAAYYNSATTLGLQVHKLDSTWLRQDGINATTPFAWGTGDSIHIVAFSYPMTNPYF